MSVVFVNYRVQEDPGYATLLHRELSEHFGPENVFLASQSIEAGDDFVREVFTRLRECEVLLALIGPRWAEVIGRDGAVDWVRREIAEALAGGILVVPVLIENADLPRESTLPADIARLSRCQAVRLRHYSFDADLAALVDKLRRVAPALQERPDRANTVAAGEPSMYRVTREPATDCLIGVIPGSIRWVRNVDIWVNSENTDMQMARHNEFSVSAIIRYWGALRDLFGRVISDVVADELAARLGDRRSLAPGTAIVTEAGALRDSNNVSRVIHVAAVHGEPGAGFRQVQNIDTCVTNALAQAEALADEDPALRTVLFPLLGTGTATGAGLEATARTMLLAALAFLADRPRTRLHTIYFLAYTTGERSVLEQVARRLPLAPLDER
ncbi:MAG: TIR domain-containing protein [Actinophytocola sp.]|uniref:TIR domain-containing protein n=1 Tax=Actinophytocola sp. TaxID=1872138 RepID=UPI003D6ADA39